MSSRDARGSRIAADLEQLLQFTNGGNPQKRRIVGAASCLRTDPEEAKAFVKATGVDLLAVAVGSSHAMTTREAILDFDLMQTINNSISLPLVLHGSSGVSDEVSHLLKLLPLI